MVLLKEYYQQKRDLLKGNKGLQLKLPPKFQNLSSPFVQPRTVLKNSFKNRGIFYVHFSRTNIIVGITNLKGKIQYVRSAGLCGFLGKKKRSTKFAVLSTLGSMIEILKDRKFDGVFLCLRGFSRARRYILKSLKKKSLKLLGILDMMPNSHNGCRPRKPRRG